jgi:hypothetical protein
LDCYKTLSSYNGTAIWQIGQNTLTEFANGCPNLVNDPKVYDINGVYLQMGSIKGNLLDKEEKKKNNNKNLPDNLVRHQFLALFVKVAKDKYIIRSKLSSNLIF